MNTPVKKLVLLSLPLLCLHLFAPAQTGMRYKDLVFEKAAIIKNILYANPQITGVKPKRQKLDIYQPAGDSVKMRPLIIWIHGGGFKFGNKHNRGIPVWARSFARRGYVCAAINYRLSKMKPLRNYPDLVGACYDAVGDLQTAVSFMKKNYLLYGIDTNQVILGGNSAGAITSLQAVYSSGAMLAKQAPLPDSVHPASAINPMQISAVINFWGAVFDTAWLANTHVPIVSVHGGKDKIVPILKGDFPLYGSTIIHRNADRLHIKNQLKVYDTRGHELQQKFFPVFISRGTKNRWQEAGQFAADFLYDEVLKLSSQKR